MAGGPVWGTLTDTEGKIVKKHGKDNNETLIQARISFISAVETAIAGASAAAEAVVAAAWRHSASHIGDPLRFKER
ncbi:hypothetical protein cyc_01984 [Cyclospora cayetanensis]|uniref:Uncharacterized protein n=1 Tax=Cyclospora cayetanensis TaxID=88456 RepID=A0A1D3CZK1_9EIME|nr:hypothetical protein cyc_01984 [Cyclospora cayetanensis]